MNVLESELAQELRAHFLPRIEQSVTDVAESEFYLPAEVTQRSGPLSTEHCNYVCEPLEDFNNDSVQESTNCFAAQTFKTTLLLIGVGFKIIRRPANILWFMPSFLMAKSLAETKWLPMVENSPALQALMPVAKDKFKKLEQQFRDCILWFVGAGSERNAKSKSAETIIVDEADDVEAEYAKKGKSVLGMIASRMKSYAGSKLFISGTPQVAHGPVWTKFLEGDRRLRFVTCPKCKGEPFAMEFSPEYIREWFPKVNAGRVVWDKEAKHKDGSWDFERVFKTTAMECPNCKAHLKQHQIPAMVRGAKWIATAPGGRSETKPSRRLPSMYSPHENTTLGKLAVKFLQDQHKVGGLRNFLNEELALPFQPKSGSIVVSDIREVVQASPPYVRGEIPRDNIALLSLTVDVNQGVFHWLTRAWYADYSTSLVDYGTVLSWSGLTSISNQKYRLGATDIEMAPMFCLIDSGWRTKSEAGVYDFCLKSAGRFIPVKGATKGQGLKKTIEESDVDLKGRPLKLIRFDEPVLKYDLYFNKIKSRDSKWWLAVNTGKDYEEQLTDEYQDSKGEWKCKHDNNHLADCEKEQLIIPALIEGIAGKDGLRVMAERVRRSAGLTSPVN